MEVDSMRKPEPERKPMTEETRAEIRQQLADKQAELDALTPEEREARRRKNIVLYHGSKGTHA